MKTKNIIATFILVLITGLSNITIAQEEKTNDNEFADYAAGISLSPFGGSVGFTHNWNPKTSFQAALGGFSGSAPISPEINGTSYDIDNSTSWIGMFINHRPFADADWFRLGTGIGIGTIKNTLSSEGSGDQYQADYEGNIVGYVGVGVGGQPKKGLVLSLDLGLLSTSGANVTGPDASTTTAISNDATFGALLPNIQLGVAWGF
jgi:hypothetical protein